MKSEKPKIACLQNGPYCLLNDIAPRPYRTSWIREVIPALPPPAVALCRCGGSSNKPF
jgi:CDGSH-type Zn-finger protein